MTAASSVPTQLSPLVTDCRTQKQTEATAPGPRPSRVDTGSTGWTLPAGGLWSGFDKDAVVGHAYQRPEEIDGSRWELRSPGE